MTAAAGELSHFFFLLHLVACRSSHDFVILSGLHAQTQLASTSRMARIERILMTLCMMLTSCAALEALRKQELHKPKDFHSCSAGRTISSSSGGTVGCDVAALEWDQPWLEGNVFEANFASILWKSYPIHFGIQ